LLDVGFGEDKERGNRMRVKHVMSAPVTTVGRKEAVHVAEAIMRQSGFRHLPVAAKNELIGIVTERDLHRAADVLSRCSEEAKADGRTALVEDVMSRTIVTAGPETPLTYAAELMLKNAVGSLPVLECGRLVGILTRSDVLRWIARSPGERADRRGVAPRQLPRHRQSHQLR
jgi:CBS domain-containing protein